MNMTSPHLAAREGSIMKKVFAFAITVTLACGWILAQSSRTAEAEFKAAQHKEEVVGDFKGAIDQYKKIANGKDRALAAMALLRIAALYQKQGAAEAQKVYERIAREFTDQTDAAAEARTRLVSLRPPTLSVGMTTRQVWSGLGNGFGGALGNSISRDGRYFTYTKNLGNSYVLRDLVNGVDRSLTGAVGIETSFSRDGKTLAYTSCDQDHCGLRLVNVQDGNSQFKTLYDNGEVAAIVPHDWTPDNKLLAVSLRRKDQSAQIGLVSTERGELRVLKSVDWRGPTRMFVSPDGKYLALDIPASDTSAQRDIFVLALDGSSEKAAVVDPANDVVMGWSPDSRYLIFASERTAPSISLWALRLAEGQPQEAPQMLKRDFGPGESMGLTPSGTLYYKLGSPATTRLQVASFDFGSEEFTPPRNVPVFGLASSNSRPDWSPNGKYLAYHSNRLGAGRTQDFTLVVHSLESGQARELHPAVIYPQSGAKWSPDGSSFLVDGIDFKGRWGIFRIDAETGETAALVEGQECENGNCFFPAWAPDGKSIYYLQGGLPDRGNDVVVRDLSSGTVKKLFHNDSTSLHHPMPSPDGRYIAVRGGRDLMVQLIATAGGPLRRLMSGTVVAWAPDSRSLIIRSFDPVARSVGALWRVPVEGEAHKIELGADLSLDSIHPDGRQVAFTVRDPQSEKPQEIWAIENFLPRLEPNKR
jgi:Tol biopolymer transport system component